MHLMSENHLSKSGLFFDDLNKLRILDNEAAIQSNDLQEQCRFFVENINEYKRLVDGLIETSHKLAQQVEREKIKALHGKNLLKSATEQRASKQQQLQVQLFEKRTELERLQAEYRSLQRTEQEQQEMLHHLLQQ